MAGAHVFQEIQHPELDSFDLVAIRNFLKNRARYLRLVAQNNKTDGANVTPNTMVASIDPELLENLIDMEKVDANLVDDCTDESVMEFLESTRERDASVTAEYVKAVASQHLDSDRDKFHLHDFIHIGEECSASQTNVVVVVMSTITVV
jgi:hypothetical protein